MLCGWLSRGGRGGRCTVPMMCSKRHLPDIEQWNQSSGSNVIPRRARSGLAGLRPHIARQSRRFGIHEIDQLLLPTKEVPHPQPVIPRTCATHRTRPPALPRMGGAVQSMRSGWTMHARLDFRFIMFFFEDRHRGAEKLREIRKVPPEF